jgi:hypothetical protein
MVCVFVLEAMIRRHVVLITTFFVLWRTVCVCGRVSLYQGDCTSGTMAEGAARDMLYLLRCVNASLYTAIRAVNIILWHGNLAYTAVLCAVENTDATLRVIDDLWKDCVGRVGVSGFPCMVKRMSHIKFRKCYCPWSPYLRRVASFIAWETPVLGVCYCCQK